MTSLAISWLPTGGGGAARGGVGVMALSRDRRCCEGAWPCCWAWLRFMSTMAAVHSDMTGVVDLSSLDDHELFNPNSSPEESDNVSLPRLFLPLQIKWKNLYWYIYLKWSGITIIRSLTQVTRLKNPIPCFQSDSWNSPKNLRQCQNWWMANWEVYL